MIENFLKSQANATARLDAEEVGGLGGGLGGGANGLSGPNGPPQSHLTLAHRADMATTASSRTRDELASTHQGHAGGLGAADWHECLYAFHASRGDWRQAAHAMHTLTQRRKLEPRWDESAEALLAAAAAVQSADALLAAARLELRRDLRGGGGTWRPSSVEEEEEEDH